MSEDLSKLLGNMLANPDALKNLMGSVNSQSRPLEPNGNVDIQGIMNSLNNTNDRRVTLLTALKPYLSTSKSANVDKAIQLIKMTKIAEILRNEGKM